MEEQIEKKVRKKLCTVLPKFINVVCLIGYIFSVGIVTFLIYTFIHSPQFNQMVHLNITNPTGDIIGPARPMNEYVFDVLSMLAIFAGIIWLLDLLVSNFPSTKNQDKNDKTTTNI